MVKVLTNLIPLTLFCFSWLAACDSNLSQTEREFKSALQRLNRLLQDYDKIPEKQEVHKSGAVISKDKDQVASFYKNNEKEFQSLDDSLLGVVRSGGESRWYDDAIFCRGILYSLWAQVHPERALVEKAVGVLGDYIKLPLQYSLEDRTKASLQGSFWDQYKDLVSPGQTYEENVRLVFQSLIAYLFLKLEEYQIAIQQYELIVKTYPTSMLSQHAKRQIEGIKDLLAGKIAMPG